MHRAVESYIKQELILSIEKHLKKDKDYIAKEYKNYISSLGAAIQLSGLIPALAFFHDGGRENEKSGSAQKREPLLEILKECLSPKFEGLADKTLFRYALEKRDDRQTMRRLEREISFASIALKLALRSFHLKKTPAGT